MKKLWSNPEMEALELKETAGGPINNEKADSDYYAHTDAEGNVLYWSKDYGTTEETFSE